MFSAETISKLRGEVLLRRTAFDDLTEKAEAAEAALDEWSQLLAHAEAYAEPDVKMPPFEPAGVLVAADTVPISGVAPGTTVSCPVWNDGSPVQISGVYNIGHGRVRVRFRSSPDQVKDDVDVVWDHTDVTLMPPAGELPADRERGQADWCLCGHPQTIGMVHSLTRCYEGELDLTPALPQTNLPAARGWNESAKAGSFFAPYTEKGATTP